MLVTTEDASTPMMDDAKLYNGTAVGQPLNNNCSVIKRNLQQDKYRLANGKAAEG